MKDFFSSSTTKEFILNGTINQTSMEWDSYKLILTFDFKYATSMQVVISTKDNDIH